MINWVMSNCAPLYFVLPVLLQFLGNWFERNRDAQNCGRPESHIHTYIHTYAHTYIPTYAHTMYVHRFLAGKSPLAWSYTACMHGSGQPCANIAHKPCTTPAHAAVQIRMLRQRFSTKKARKKQQDNDQRKFSYFLCHRLCSVPPFVFCATVCFLCHCLFYVPPFVFCATFFCVTVCVLCHRLCSVPPFVFCATVCFLCHCLFSVPLFVFCATVCALCHRLCSVPPFVVLCHRLFSVPLFMFCATVCALCHRLCSVPPFVVLCHRLCSVPPFYVPPLLLLHALTSAKCSLCLAHASQITSTGTQQ